MGEGWGEGGHGMVWFPLTPALSRQGRGGQPGYFLSKSQIIDMTGSSPTNHENGFSLSLVEDPAKLWRGWERVGVRVSQSLCPLTSILSPGGERRYIRGYFQAN
jgi:hypothetical protein